MSAAFVNIINMNALKTPTIKSAKTITPKMKMLAVKAGIFILSATITIGDAIAPSNYAIAQRLKEKLSLTEIGWLEDDRNYVTHLSTTKPLCLAPPENKEIAALMDIGSVAFRSPLLFGGLAARKKLSCDSCHQNGDVNDEFFIKGLSDKPGHIDATNAVFSKTLEDNIYNPIPIPTLYGINDKQVFGTLSPTATKAEFVHQVIEQEFDGPKPNQRIFDGLMAYIDHFDTHCTQPTGTALRPSNDQDNKKINRSAESDFSHIQKAINTAYFEWQNGHINIADFILISARHELGLIYERYDRQSLSKPSKGLIKLSAQLEQMRSNIKPVLLLQKPVPTRTIDKQFTRWQKDAKKLSAKIKKGEARSYYRADQLEALLIEDE